MIFTALFIGLSYAELHPKGSLIEDAILIDCPSQGLDAMADVIPALIPSPLDLPEFSDESSACPTGGWWYRIQFKRAWADIEVTNAQLTPQDGYIDANIDLEIRLNNTSDLFRLNYWLVCIKYRCDGYVEPFNANVTGQFAIELSDEDGDGVAEADVTFADTLNITYDLTGDHIQLSNCPIAGIDDIFQFFGGSLYDLVLNSIDLETLLADALPGLEATIEEALASTNINEVVDLGGVELNLVLSPKDILISEDGLRLAMNASASAETNDCVSEFDPEGSLKTEGAMAEIIDFPSDYHMGATVSDDFLNQTLYAVWSAGLLCQTIDAELFPIDTSILNLLTGDAFDELFPETKAMTIQTKPKIPLELNMGTDSSLAVDVEEMELGFYAEVDGRRSKVLSVDISTDVGIDLGLDSATGSLELAIDLDPERVVAFVSDNEFLPGEDQTIEESFVSQLDTILGLIDIDSLLGDLGLFMPSFPAGEEYIGIDELNVAGSGSIQEDLGLYFTIGTVPYNGCSAENSGGCLGDLGAGCAIDPSDCQGGCSTNGRPNGRMFLLFFVAVLGFLRRRS